MSTENQTVSSNLSGLYYALSDSGIPDPLTLRRIEPNSYSSFGQVISKTSRNPIESARQMRKGLVSDSDIAAAFQTDMLFDSTTFKDWWSSFFFAASRKIYDEPLPTNRGDSASDVAATGRQGKRYNIYPNSPPLAGEVYAYQKNGVWSFYKVIVDSGTKFLERISDDVFGGGPTATEYLPTADADVINLKLIGFTYRSANFSSMLNTQGTELTLNDETLASINHRITPTTNLNGVFVNVVASQTSGKGSIFSRIDKLDGSVMKFDKVGDLAKFSGLTASLSITDIYVIFPEVISNSTDGTGIRSKCFMLERTLSTDATIGSEVVFDALGNQATISLSVGDKPTVDWEFIAREYENRNKKIPYAFLPTTTRQDPVYDTLATVSDIYFIGNMRRRSDMTKLFDWLIDGSITINNNIQAIKALGKLGAVDLPLGNFQVSMDTTALFKTLDIEDTIINNETATADFVFFNRNEPDILNAVMFDFPSFTINASQNLSVQLNQPVQVPMSLDCFADETLKYSAAIHIFPFISDTN